MSVRVLVVEDDDDLARLLTIRLRNADFEVERAADGEAGVRLTREFDPEFVLMDWMMPVKSGIEAVEDIRAVTQTGRRRPNAVSLLGKAR